MNNPFATQAPPAAASGNPFAPAASTAGTNPFAAVTTPPGVQAIQQAFAPAVPAVQPAPANPFAPAVDATPVAPPLNPPGEAGLGLAPAAVAAPVEPATPVVEPEPAPRARRGRKPKADRTPAEVEQDIAEQLQNPTLGPAPAEGVDLLTCTTEELVQALKSRGYSVTLKDG